MNETLPEAKMPAVKDAFTDALEDTLRALPAIEPPPPPFLLPNLRALAARAHANAQNAAKSEGRLSVSSTFWSRWLTLPRLAGGAGVATIMVFAASLLLNQPPTESVNIAFAPSTQETAANNAASRTETDGSVAPPVSSTPTPNKSELPIATTLPPSPIILPTENIAATSSRTTVPQLIAQLETAVALGNETGALKYWCELKAAGDVGKIELSPASSSFIQQKSPRCLDAIAN